MDITDKDKRLLRTLQSDCQQSNQAIAERVGMSTSACWRRIKEFEETGVIRRYAAIVDRAKAGLNFSAIVMVSLERQNSDNVTSFIDAISERDEIIQCLSTTGEPDYHMHVSCRDQHAFNAFLDDFLFKLPGIARIQTNVVLKEIKRGIAAPV